MTLPRPRLAILCLALSLPALAACSGHNNAATFAARDAASLQAAAAPIAAGSGDVQVSADAASSGDMQALLAKLAPPASDAAAAATQFHGDGDAAVPTGALAAGLDALRDAKSRAMAQMQAHAPDNPAVAPGANAGHAADHHAQLAFNATLRQQQMWLIQVGTPFAMLQGEVDEIRQHAESAHAAIDHGLDSALAKIPAIKVSTDGTGCYDAANAARVYALDLQDADRHITAAKATLGEAAAWARAVHDDASKAAVFSDTLTAQLAAIRDPASRRIYGGQVDASRNTTLGRFFDFYATSARDFDLAAAHWVHARDTKRAQGVARWLCKD